MFYTFFNNKLKTSIQKFISYNFFSIKLYVQSFTHHYIDISRTGHEFFLEYIYNELIDLSTLRQEKGSANAFRF